LKSIANAAPKPAKPASLRGRASRVGDIEITPVMVEAAARVLLNDTTLDIGPSIAEDLAEQMLRDAMKAFRKKF
jgi:hypothetical protein